METNDYGISKGYLKEGLEQRLILMHTDAKAARLPYDFAHAIEKTRTIAEYLLSIRAITIQDNNKYYDELEELIRIYESRRLE